MIRNISVNINNYMNKDNLQKEINEKKYIHNISLLYDILKDLEKEVENKNLYNEKNKNIIHSLFSILYFELLFLQQLNKNSINCPFKLNKNNFTIDKIINYNKEILSKKIEKFLLHKNEKIRNDELYKNYTQNTYTNKDNKKGKIDFKNSTYLKKNFNDNNNFKKLDKKITNSHERFVVNKKKNSQIENSNNDLAKNKINYRFIYDPTSKNNQLNKTNNIIFRNQTKKIQIFFGNKNESRNNFKTNKSYKDINKLIKKKIQNSNNDKYSIKDIKNNKTINNFNLKSNEIHHNKIKNNSSNNDISCLYLSYDEQNNNPIRKVKNIIIKVRNKNKNMSMDCKNTYNSNKDKKFNIEQDIHNDEENKNNSNNKNEYKIRSKSGYLFSFNRGKDKIKVNANLKNTFYHRERETKEILYDCMNQIQKKLNSSDKNNNNKNAFYSISP